jgi:hypothetical protein
MGMVFLSVLLAGAASTAQDLSVRAYVDRNVIGLNEQFTLSVELSGKGANSASDPAVPQIDPFAAFLGSGSSQNIQFVNGRMSVTKVISLYFAATAAGKYKIPPLEVTADGKKYASNPVDIEIVQGGAKSQQQAQPQQQAQTQGAGPAEGDLFLRATVDRRQVFQNEPVIVTYKIYTRVSIANVGLSKMPATAGFWAEEFEIPQQLQTTSEILDGKKYTVATVKKMALFPLSPGAKTLEAMTLDCEVHVRQSRSRDPFADFFDDSFFFGSKTVRKQIQSRPVTVDVLPFPDSGKSANFSGLSGRFRISASADKRSVKTNEAITYKITVEGEGNIRQVQIPDIAFPADFEVYPPKVSETVNRSGGSVSGRKAFEYVLIPRAAGEETLKPVLFSYFDPASKTYKTVQTETVTLQVAQGAETFTTVAGSGLSKEEVRLIGQDIRFIKIAMPSFHKIGTSRVKPFYFWLIFGLPLFGLAGAFAYRRHLDRLSGDVAYARGIRASSAVRKRLSTAKGLVKSDTRKQFYAEAERALEGYLGDKLNIAEAGMIKEEVEKLLRERGLGDETIRNYFECLSVCELKRFSPEGATIEEMKAFFKQVETAIMKIEKEL